MHHAVLEPSPFSSPRSLNTTVHKKKGRKEPSAERKTLCPARRTRVRARMRERMEEGGTPHLVGRRRPRRPRASFSVSESSRSLLIASSSASASFNSCLGVAYVMRGPRPGAGRGRRARGAGGTRVPVGPPPHHQTRRRTPVGLREAVEARVLEARGERGDAKPWARQCGPGVCRVAHAGESCAYTYTYATHVDGLGFQHHAAGDTRGGGRDVYCKRRKAGGLAGTALVVCEEPLVEELWAEIPASFVWRSTGKGRGEGATYYLLELVGAQGGWR
ncbi:hypothetical protein FB451DRAFT_1366729 [Mycena latifolia]|nr:hypothetical protein FB451DRAFT_1366729 [Mycena latifolia]